MRFIIEAKVRHHPPRVHRDGAQKVEWARNNIIFSDFWQVFVCIEFYFYYICFSIVVPYMFYVTYKLSTGKKGRRDEREWYTYM